LLICGAVLVKLEYLLTIFFKKKYDLNILVFPSLELINQYNIDYILNENYTEFSDYTFLSFCSDN